MQNVPDDLVQVLDRDALRRDRHHDPGQTGAGLPHLERMHGLPRREVLGQAVEAERARHPHRIRAELRSEHRIDQQPLDQLANPGLLFIG
jgi:hypothetical protein